MWDLLIKDGWVIDGTGNPWFGADVGVQGGRIVALGPGLQGAARTLIPAKHRIVCPGFIDTHAHSDWWLIARPLHDPKVQQGITTELVGQDGFSLGPVTDPCKDTIRRLVAGMHGDPPVDWSWSSFHEYLEAIGHAHPSVNAVGLVGHGTVRVATMGMEHRPPTTQQLAAMKDRIAEAMEEGAAGMSTGLLYAPCYYAPASELIELSRTVAEHAGILVVHLRSEGERLLASIDEMLSISEESGVSLHISHLKVFGRRHWGMSDLVLARLEQARERGIDVTFDQYPYTAGSTGLSAVLPPWVNVDGPERTLERLRNRADRERIKIQAAYDTSYENFFRAAGSENIVISWVRSEDNKWMEGKSVAEIASRRGSDPVELVLDLLLEERLEVAMINFSLAEEDVRRILVHPLQMVASDSILLGKPHPRAYGTYPRILGHYVREERLLSLQDAVRKMTSLPAQRLRLRDRGIVQQGAWADLVIFNPQTIADRATFEQPMQYPVGIDYVIVNGVPTVQGGQHLGARAGHVLTVA